MGGSVRLLRVCLGWRLVRFEAMKWYNDGGVVIVLNEQNVAGYDMTV